MGNLLQSLTRLLKDPPPGFAFELSPAGLAAARIGTSPAIFFRELEPDVLAVSPLRDNVLRPEALAAQVRAAAPGNGSRKRRTAALILPDYCVRVSVIDFDAFPSDPREQLSLIRFRLKKSLPFDVESAAVSYSVQASATGGKKKMDVVAAVAPWEIVARYEAPLRAAGFHVGWVTTSMLAALHLVPPGGLKILAKRTGSVLSIAVQDGGALKLTRSIELDEVSPSEILNHLYPTFVFVEDQLSVRPGSLLLCGFGSLGPGTREFFQNELGVPVSSLASRYGEPGEFNAGLLGYLASLEEF